MATDLYHRAISFDYGDEERRALMEKVWSVTPWMVDAFIDSDEREREVLHWCREHLGDEAWPIHGRPGVWQRGSATINGWTWFGFATEEMMLKFQAQWLDPGEGAA